VNWVGLGSYQSRSNSNIILGLGRRLEIGFF
jgi:hypothetical protein